MRDTDSVFRRVSQAISLVACAVFYLIPLAYLAGRSFYSGARGEYQLENYRALALGESRRQLVGSLEASIIFTVLSVAAQLALALGTAILTRRHFAGAKLLRMLFIFPYFLPTVVVLIAWHFITNPPSGLLSVFLRGFDLPYLDVRSPSSALFVMVIISVYEAFPFCYAVLLARMLQIPSEMYAIAELEGASASRKFLVVTWPAIRSILLGLIMVRLLITFFKFDVPWLVYASRGYSRWSETFSVLIYRLAFEYLQLGVAFAASSAFIAVAIILAGLIFSAGRLRKI